MKESDGRPNKMRGDILEFSFIEPNLKISGGIRRIIELANCLVKRGHRVVIYHPSGEKCTWLKCLAETKEIKNIGKNRHQVVIYNYPLQSNIFSQVKAEIKIYYILHAFHLIYDPVIVIPTYQEPGVIKIACSQWVADRVQKYIKEPIPIIYAGINRRIFHPIPGRKKEVDVIFYGVKRRWKGTKTILGACEIGKFSYDFYEGKNLKQKELADFICKGRVFVSGSWFEGWNNCSLEAMACGVPVVTTDCGGNHEFAVDGLTCLVVPPKNSLLMAEKIRLLLNDKNLREKISTNGYHKSWDYDWEKSVVQFEEIIKGQ